MRKNSAKKVSIFVVKLCSRPCIYLFPKEDARRQADRLMVRDALIKTSVLVFKPLKGSEETQ